GLPYFVLSSTGPLMQKWFSQTNPGVSPYRLYALSNVGSLLALLSYPFVFEVKFPRHTQALMWSGGLVVFVLFCGYCARQVWLYANAVPAPAPVPTPAVAAVPVAMPFPAVATAPGDSLAAPITEAPPPPVSAALPAEANDAPQPTDKLLWIGLPAIASILLLATTNKLSQEVAV